MYVTIIAFVLALLFPVLPTAAAQDPAPAKPGCCQMHADHTKDADHSAHGKEGAGACCSEEGDKANKPAKAECKNCKDGKCADCCKDGNCTGCCDEKNGACCDHATHGSTPDAKGCCARM